MEENKGNEKGQFRRFDRGQDRDRGGDRFGGPRDRFGGQRSPFKKGPTKRERIFAEMKQKMKTAYLSRDAVLVYIDGMIGDLEKALNLLFERLNEWYSIYFPELKVLDRSKYCKLVIAINKEDMEGTKARVKEVAGDKADEILKQLETSIGIELLGKDIQKIQETAEKSINTRLIKMEIIGFLIIN